MESEKIMGTLPEAITKERERLAAAFEGGICPKCSRTTTHSGESRADGFCSESCANEYKKENVDAVENLSVATSMAGYNSSHK